jgi:hypothetical protein
MPRYSQSARASSYFTRTSSTIIILAQMDTCPTPANSAESPKKWQLAPSVSPQAEPEGHFLLLANDVSRAPVTSTEAESSLWQIEGNVSRRNPI